jgi:hypothetical protein
VVGVTGDLIDDYLSQLRARLRTPAERTEQILAEAEDHLRESAAAGEALGLSERDAQEVAIENFGSARAVVRAHRRRPASVVEVSLAACQLLALYLLAVAGAGVLLATVLYLLTRSHVFAADGSPRGHAAASAPPVAVDGAATLAGCAVAGLVLLACYRLARRSLRRSRPAPEAPLGGYFPLFAGIFMLIFGPIAVITIARLAHPSGAFMIPGAAGVLGSMVVALGYAGQMARTLIRQRRGTGRTGEGAHYA